MPRNYPPTNLVRMKGTKRYPEAGDVFCMQLPSEKFLFGRVRFSNVAREFAPMPGANLVYIYDWLSETMKPDYELLRCGRLLIAPVWTNRMGWSRGYFHHIENRTAEDAITFGKSCFESHSRRGLVDERGRPLDRRIGLCGEWGLVSYRWIDDHVSDALGIARVPVD